MNGQDQRSSESPATGLVPPEIEQAPSLSVPAEGVGEILANQAPQLEDAHHKFAEFHQSYVTGYIQLADTKAAWVFAVASGLTAYIFSSSNIQNAIQFQKWDWLTILVCATVALLVLTAVFSFLVIAPRLSRSRDGVVFFGSIASRASPDEFVREVAGMGEPELIEARLRHGYDISKICARKYRLLTMAFRTGILALVGIAFVVLLT